MHRDREIPFGMWHSDDPFCCYVWGAIHKAKLVWDPSSSLALSIHSFVGVLQSSAFPWYFVLFLLEKERPPSCGRHRHSLLLIWLCISRPSTRNPRYPQLPMDLADYVQHQRPRRSWWWFQPFTVLLSSQLRKSSMSLGMVQR